MNKNAIQKYAIWARNELIEQVKQRAYQYGISSEGYGEENASVINGRVLTSDEKRQRREFVGKIEESNFDQAVEEVAYTWFNRFIALRFMEVNDYLPSHIRVIGGREQVIGNSDLRPEILIEALHLELDGLDKAKVSEMLNANQTEELYRYLLLTQCNALNAALPEMFEKLGSYTEMLLPNNILKQDSVLARLVNEIDEDDWKDAVQIIGWMYQYYNTEPKQAVFDGLKKNVKITKEKIPAATQLFTPDWIVRYMVENSLGRLWLEHCRAESGLTDEYMNASYFGWKYYIEEAEQTPEVAEKLSVLRSQSPVKSPEDIRLIDPCMGSGHILVYAFDVLMQIYESEGYNPRDAARLILEKNIYGLEIDKRAYQLAYFALMMKARQYNRRILTSDIKPNVFYFIDSNRILESHLDLMGANLMPVELPACKENIPHLLDDFSDATEYGSLLKIGRAYPYELLKGFAKSQKTGQMTITDNPQNYYNIKASEIDLLQIIDLAETLEQKYDVVVTNPPYMGSSGMGAKLSGFVKSNYPDSKSDLFAVFIEKCGELLKATGYQAMITQHAWMFLSSYEKLRSKLLLRDIVNMAHLGAKAFEEIGGEVVQTTAFVLSKHDTTAFKATYVRLVDYNSQDAKEEAFLSGSNRYTAGKENFEKIPGSPVAYWASEKICEVFGNETLEDIVSAVKGLDTCNNDRFMREWHEVNVSDIGFDIHKTEDTYEHSWFPYCKGGGFRRWYGFLEKVVFWKNDGEILRNLRGENGKIKSRPQNIRYYFNEGITFSTITSYKLSTRFMNYCIFGGGGSGIFSNYNINEISAFLNTNVCEYLLNILNPTFNLLVGDILSLPIVADKNQSPFIDNIVKTNISLSKTDWDSFETSWDFTRHSLICGQRTVEAAADMGEWSYTIKSAFENWEATCNNRFTQLKENEEELNRIFIGIYGLQDELTPEVDDKDVTVRRADLGREIRSLISYAVGCMFGRYSLDEEGLILAGQSYDERFVYASSPVAGGGPLYRVQGDCYLLKSDGTHQICTYAPDKDNILPICDDEYFDDDIMGRFVEFTRVVYGDETLEENLKFVADALGGSGTPREVIRNYFLKDFFKDHCKIYQKRPIYWLFDSGKKNGFKALIYLHRYQSDLLAKLRTDYVHEQQERYRTQLSHIAGDLNSSTGSERARLMKQQNKLTEQLKEITAFEEKVHHLADQHIEIDLDDGVKKNYEIFADVVAKI